MFGIEPYYLYPGIYVVGMLVSVLPLLWIMESHRQEKITERTEAYDAWQAAGGHEHGQGYYRYKSLEVPKEIGPAQDAMCAALFWPVVIVCGALAGICVGIGWICKNFMTSLAKLGRVMNGAL